MHDACRHNYSPDSPISQDVPISVICEHAYNVAQRERHVTDLTFELARLERSIVREKMRDFHGVLLQRDVVLAQVFAETFGLPQLP